MTADSVLAVLRDHASAETLAQMGPRYGIHTASALGVPMAAMKKVARDLGRDHALASELWLTGVYEARTVAALVDEPALVTIEQMDAWCADFDTWALCDTVCFSLFDRAPDAWSRLEPWARDERELVRRASFALLWSLALHDTSADDARFVAGLALVEQDAADERPLVTKSDVDVPAGHPRDAAPPCTKPYGPRRSASPWRTAHLRGASGERLSARAVPRRPRRERQAAAARSRATSARACRTSSVSLPRAVGDVVGQVEDGAGQVLAGPALPVIGGGLAVGLARPLVDDGVELLGGQRAGLDLGGEDVADELVLTGGGQTEGDRQHREAQHDRGANRPRRSRARCRHRGRRRRPR